MPDEQAKPGRTLSDIDVSSLSITASLGLPTKKEQWCNGQAASPLYSRVPGEVRMAIFLQALLIDGHQTASADAVEKHDPRRVKRPFALLVTCRRVYSEAQVILVEQVPHIFLASRHALPFKLARCLHTFLAPGLPAGHQPRLAKLSLVFDCTYDDDLYSKSLEILQSIEFVRQHGAVVRFDQVDVTIILNTFVAVHHFVPLLFIMRAIEQPCEVRVDIQPITTSEVIIDMYNEELKDTESYASKDPKGWFAATQKAWKRTEPKDPKKGPDHEIIRALSEEIELAALGPADREVSELDVPWQLAERSPGGLIDDNEDSVVPWFFVADDVEAQCSSSEIRDLLMHYSRIADSKTGCLQG